ncbi:MULTISPECIES: hypothetical protein [unclassified Mesorhizobium]|uniref:hypothetical protein n=1 Tax=unclassified Mesorhizobium TaxID=325217 RepID=UPI0016793177|nr:MULTISPECIES: hypothetical protein [unclassified Mesorhizobium]
MKALSPNAEMQRASEAERLCGIDVKRCCPRHDRSIHGWLARSLNQSRRGLFDLIGRIIEFGHTLQNASVQHFEPRDPMQFGALSSVQVQGFKHHHGDVSLLHGRRRHDLQQLPSGCFSAPLFSPNAGTKGEADRDPTTLFEHRLGLLEGEFRSLHALSGDCLFQNYKFDHYSASSRRLAIPSKGEPPPISLVPLTECRGGATRREHMFAAHIALTAIAFATVLAAIAGCLP